MPTPSATIYGCKALRLEEAERAFFREADPAGFILFARNVETPEQVRALVAELKDCTGRSNTLVLIDQEGGRVARLRPPHWRAAPPQGRFGALALNDPETAERAARLNARLIASELADLGINVDCLPLLDLRLDSAHDIVGDRAFGDNIDIVSRLGQAVCEGLLESGVLPVIKHMPGHGRALVDSHENLPVVTEDRATLDATDFEPFRRLAEMPLAMTAHIVYQAIDPDRPATTSPIVIGDILRGAIGFDGLLMTDDLSMKALGGSFAQRTGKALAAGCDLVLHCNGDAVEMAEVAGAARPLDADGMRRFAQAVSALKTPGPLNREGAVAELDRLMADNGASRA